MKTDFRGLGLNIWKQGERKDGGGAGGPISTCPLAEYLPNHFEHP